jgi:RNA polymerase sigma-70 factor (ECF subfamily)
MANTFSEACLPHRAEMRRLALRLTRNAADADDVVQEALEDALVAWPRFRDGAAPLPWLLRIVTNAFISAYRKRTTRSELLANHAGDVVATCYGAGAVACESAAADGSYGSYGGLDVAVGIQGDVDVIRDARVRRAVADLPPDYREVIERADFAGEMYKDIAADLNVPIGTVMSRLHRARRQLLPRLELLGITAEGFLSATTGRRSASTRGSK